MGRIRDMRRIGRMGTMWRDTGVHQKNDTEFLADAVDRVFRDRGLRHSADRLLHDEAMLEPLVADALKTPQSPRHHAEGPYVEDHLLLMSQVLSAVLGDKLHLVDIEEFAALKGFEGEIEELEETLKENAALYEAFVLCHDAPKWATVCFDAPEGSGGRAAGFVADAWAHRHDMGISERAKFRARYAAMYETFRLERPEISPVEAQRQFYLTYAIDVHYSGHDRAIHSPVYRALVGRVADRRRLQPRDADLLETLVAHHMDPIADFASSNPAAVLRYHALAAKHGYDADDFVDLLQGCVFLDTVCGSRTRLPAGKAGDKGRITNDATILVNFLRSEHDFAPWRRAEKERVREEKRKRARNVLFREAGLDGLGLMDLLRMEPGPKFGAVLAEIQSAIVNGTEIPKFTKAIDEQMGKRIDAYFKLAFPSGS